MSLTNLDKFDALFSWACSACRVPLTACLLLGVMAGSAHAREAIDLDDERPSASDQSTPKAPTESAKPAVTEPPSDKAPTGKVPEPPADDEAPANSEPRSSASETSGTTHTAKWEDVGGRFRGGFGLTAGTFVAPVRGPVFGLYAELGAQINDLVGVYWRPSLHGGFGFSDGEVLGAASTGQLVMADATFQNRFQVGLGGGVHGGSFGTCGSTEDCDTSRGWFPAVAARVAWLPSDQSAQKARRASFSLSLNNHNVIVDGQVVSHVTLGVGASWY